ncbi:MAG: hypothetical protein FWG92_06525 [Leptospirales bacterium]|nr:hypothetical protein [Leptospirales bacterium]
MKIRIFLLITFLFSLCAHVFASDAGSRASYTRGGWAGARYIAAGQCGVVLADDVYSIYWNPAGLSELKSKKKAMSDDIFERARSGNIHSITEKELLNFSKPASEMNVVNVGISGAMLDVDRNALFAGCAFGLFNGVIGFGAYSISSLSIPSYDDSGNPAGKTNYSGSIGYISYGIGLGAAAVGVSVKGLYERIDKHSYAGAALDAGSQIFLLPFLKLGFAVYDLGAGLKPLNDDGGNLENKYDLGYPSFRINAAAVSDVGFTLSFGLMKRLEQSKYFFTFGVQYDVKRFLSIYAGMCDSEFSAGLGIRAFNCEISYAFVFDSINGGANNIVSASIFF